MFSMSLNVRQLLDVTRYQNIASETQEVLKNMVPATTMPTLSASRTVPVDKTELQCMSENIYFEAATQSLIGKIAVGQVVLNRIKSGRFPRTVCGVVNQRVNDVCQFSWKCEGEKEIRDKRAWKQSQQVAYDLLSRDRKDVVDITEGATYFHGTGVKPGWKLKPVAKIDDHLFYR
jgi:spore germination cell wall hydrolase CwlJ-like protein